MTSLFTQAGNEDLYQRLTKEMAVLIKINNLTGFLPVKLDNLLVAIIKEMNEIFSPYQCTLYLLTDRQASCCELKNDNCCKALNDQLPMIVEPGENLCCRARSCAKSFRFHVCVPLVAGTEKLGVVTLKSKEHQKFDRDSMELLLAIVNQIAATIQRARLFTRVAAEKANLEQANSEIKQLNLELEKSIVKLKKTQEQLIISERLAAVGQLSANLAHEINNPTGIILSRLEWLLLEAPEQELPEEVIQDLQVIKKHTERIAGTTRGLLSFSRQAPDRVKPVDLNEIVLETIEWVRNQFQRKNVRFSWSLEPIPNIFGNPEQIEQVLINLFNNAKDAMPEGGEIMVKSAYDAPNKRVQLQVTDTGIGIPDEIKNRIFDPFFTTKGKNSGTGLGLSISYAIIENHGGRIKVDSQPGRGSCFSITLPSCTRERTELNYE